MHSWKTSAAEKQRSVCAEQKEQCLKMMSSLLMLVGNKSLEQEYCFFPEAINN